MLQTRRRLDLLHEPLGTKHRRQLRLQDLEGHLTVVPPILRQIHRCHPARAKRALDAVAIRECGRETVGQLSHARSVDSLTMGRRRDGWKDG
jgi:hypothetical protein